MSEPPLGAEAESKGATGPTPLPLRDTVTATLPRFARNYPPDPELDALVAAFVAGNYRRVHNEAPRLAARGDDAVAKAARDLVGRLQPDPFATWIIGATAVLLALLVVWAYTHQPH